jgi:hypothetical protein
MLDKKKRRRRKEKILSEKRYASEEVEREDGWM